MATFQQGLFETQGIASLNPIGSGLEHVVLDQPAWCDFQPGWVSGSDGLFEQLTSERPWNADSGEPLKPHILEQMRQSLFIEAPRVGWKTRVDEARIDEPRIGEYF